MLFEILFNASAIETNLKLFYDAVNNPHQASLSLYELKSFYIRTIVRQTFSQDYPILSEPSLIFEDSPQFRFYLQHRIPPILKNKKHQDLRDLLTQEMEHPQFLTGKELQLVQEAFKLSFDSLFHHSSYFESFYLLVNHIFIKSFQSILSSSFYNIPVDICIGFWPADLEELTILATESLLHEMVHQVFFLDECVHRLYCDERITRNTQDFEMLGALSGKNLNFNDAFQSCFVACVFVDYWSFKNDEQRALSYLPNLQSSFSRLKEILDSEPNPLLSEKGIERYHQLCEAMNRIESIALSEKTWQ